MAPESSSSRWWLLGTVSSSCVSVVLVWKWYQTRLELQQARRNRRDERIGRIRAERRLASSQLLASPDSDQEDESRSSSKDSPSFGFRPIAVVASAYRDRRGTPRQAGLVDSSQTLLSTVRFDRQWLNSVASADGLQAFSHVWVVAVFHKNTDAAKRRDRVKAKIRPPRLNGAKVGVLSTRSPHRPNAIALSSARLLQILPNGDLVLEGLDLVDGTPVLDVKPYISRYDAHLDAVCPEWINREEKWNGVDVMDQALQQVSSLTSEELGSFPSADHVLQAARQILSRDMRVNIPHQNNPALELVGNPIKLSRTPVVNTMILFFWAS